MGACAQILLETHGAVKLNASMNPQSQCGVLYLRAMSRDRARRINQTEANRQRRLATTTVVLGVFVVMVAGAWLEGRWPHAAGTYVAVSPLSAVDAADILWELRRIDGVRDAVAVTRGSLAADDIEGTGWASAQFYANQTDTSALAFLAPDPALRLQQGQLPTTYSTDEAILGHELAQALGLEVGDILFIHGQPFRVAGVWEPSSHFPGNFVQVSVAAADALAISDSQSLAYVLALPEPGWDANALAREIWRKLPHVSVLSPAWQLARVRQEHDTLALAVGSAAALALLLSLPLLSSWQPARGESKLLWVLLSAIGGCAAAYIVCFAINIYTARTLGLSPLQPSLRLSVLVLAGAATAGWLVGRFMPSLPWTLRYTATIGALALCTAGIAMLGALNESLMLALDEAQRTAADWVSLPDIKATSVLLRDMKRLPGVRGYTIEAYGGFVNADEERWDGPWPSSGLVYGIESVAGEGSLSLAYPSRYWVGGPLEPSDPTEAVVGYDLAQALGVRVGDTISVRGSPFAVVGIREPLHRDPNSNVNYRVDVTMEGLRRALHDPTVSGQITLLIPPAASQEDKAIYLQEASIRLNVAGVKTVEDRLAEIALAFPATWSLKPADSQGIVRHARAVYLLTWTLSSAFLLGLGALAAGAAIAERLSQQEQRVALMRALGSSEGMIFGQYLQQAAVLGALGASVGLLGGWALCTRINGIAPAKAAQLLLTSRLGATTFFFIVLASMVGAVAPTSRVVRRDATWVLYGSARKPEVASIEKQDASRAVPGILTHGGSEA